MNHIRRLITIFLCFLSTSCTTIQKQGTLRDIDSINIAHKPVTVYIKPKTTEEIKSAYREYLKHANSNNKSRMQAISRLAEIEFNLSDKLLEKKNVSNNALFDEVKYNKQLDRTILLLSTSLTDYPDEKTNDHILYQLSKAYDQRGLNTESIKSLRLLASHYPKSPYYIEAQFRLAEDAFSKKDYIAAEDAYTEVISSKRNELYLEKATFKRAWARYKQRYYIESVDDILRAIMHHQFDSYESLDKSEKSIFDEYYRTIGLAFAYAGGLEPLKRYIKSHRLSRLKYNIYLAVSNVYKYQQRYSDAVAILDDFIQDERNSEKLPFAYLEIMNIWKQGGFSEKLNAATSKFYLNYNPNSQYWKRKSRSNKTLQMVNRSLKEYILDMARYFHQIYLTNKKAHNFRVAEKWYLRFLKHYKANAHKNNVNFLYAELLATANQYSKALNYYEHAAYDNKIILDKRSAYATIVITDKLVSLDSVNAGKKTAYLNKHIEYSRRYTQLYPNDHKSDKILLHAAELAFSNKNYQQTILLSANLSTSNSKNLRMQAMLILAQSYYRLKQYKQAESSYQEILAESSNTKNRLNIKENIAQAIYRQAEKFRQRNNLQSAAEHFSRISLSVPQSSIAATGLYDAIAIYMQTGQWLKAINAIRKFKTLYPEHKYYKEASKKLSLAYLNSNQNLKAAREFENVSNIDNNSDVKMAALLQAAKLYEEKKDIASAIRLYSKYARKYKKPYPQYLETLYKLANLTAQLNRHKKSAQWRNKIIQADKSINHNAKTKRTRYIVSSALLTSAKENEKRYFNIKLVRPLKTNLRKKKVAMQKSVRLYGQATIYKLAKPSSQATHSIAALYYDFSKALLHSELPHGLSKAEQEQYQILLEDKAFPFEEKAIEFHEINMEQTKYNIYNEWVKKSHEKLIELFPVRYNRKFKIDEYANALH